MRGTSFNFLYLQKFFFFERPEGGVLGRLTICNLETKLFDGDTSVSFFNTITYAKASPITH